MRELFGELRSLLQGSSVRFEGRLRRVLIDAHDKDPESYRDQVVPYLESFELPTFEAYSFEHFEQLDELLPMSARVEVYSLQGFALQDDEIEQLVALPGSRRIRALYLRSGELSLPGLVTLLSAERIGPLRALEVQRLDLSTLDVCGFWDDLDLSEVEHLRCVNASLTGEFMDGVLSPERLPKLRRLDLSFNELDARAVQRFAERSWQGIEVLNLGGAKLDAEAGAALFGSSVMDELVELSCFNSKMGDLALEPLEGRSGRATLRELNLYGCELSEEGLRRVVECREMAELRELDLGGNRLGAASAFVLAECDGLQHVEALNLGFNQLGDVGVAFLVGAEHLGQVRKLRLGSNGLTSEAARLLASSTAFPSLRELWIHANDMGVEGLDALRASRTLPRGLKVHPGGGSFVLEALKLDE